MEVLLAFLATDYTDLFLHPAKLQVDYLECESRLTDWLSSHGKSFFLRQLAAKLFQAHRLILRRACRARRFSPRVTGCCHYLCIASRL